MSHVLPCAFAQLRERAQVHTSAPTRGDDLLGFIWTACPSAQFITISTGGLRCYELTEGGTAFTKASKELQGVANADKARLLWYKYQHDSRILLLGTQFDLLALQITAQVYSGCAMACGSFHTF